MLGMFFSIYCIFSYIYIGIQAIKAFIDMKKGFGMYVAWIILWIPLWLMSPLTAFCFGLDWFNRNILKI